MLFFRLAAFFLPVDMYALFCLYFGQTCRLMVFHAILRQISNFRFCAISSRELTVCAIFYAFSNYVSDHYLNHHPLHYPYTHPVLISDHLHLFLIISLFLVNISTLFSYLFLIIRFLIILTILIILITLFLIIRSATSLGKEAGAATWQSSSPGLHKK